MAKVLFTAIVADMRNKLNGSVFSRNRAGAYMRTKVTPINPQSSDQTIVRQRLGSLSSQWRGLTEEQRSAWNAAVEAFPRMDQFGNPYFLSGQSLYVALNTNLLTIEETTIDLPPTPVSFPEFIALSATADASSSSIGVDLTGATPAGFQLVVQATPQVSPGVSFFKNKYRQILVLPVATATPLILGSAYEAKFGELIAGQKLSIKIYLISTTTGQAGVPSTIDVVVVP